MSATSSVNSLSALSALVKHSEPEKHANLKGYISSIKQSFQIFDYHYIEAKKNLELPYIEDGFINKTEQEMLLQGKNSHAHLFIAHQAHCIATAQTIRSAYDVFSQILNIIYSLEVEMHKCDFVKIKNAIRKKEFCKKLGAICSSDNFKYLTAFNNTTKHRFNVERKPVRSHESLAMYFREFRFNKYEYAEINSIAFLEKMKALEAELLSCCELVLNQYKEQIDNGGSCL